MSEHPVADWLGVREQAGKLVGSGRIATGSLYDLRDQASLYLEAMGIEATKRQIALREQEIKRERRGRLLVRKRS